MWTAASLRVARRYTARPGIPAIALAAAAPWLAGWLWLAAAALAALTGAVLLFFRDPPRRPLPAPPGTVYAVTDGTVKAVRRDVTVPWLPGGPYTQVSVFLSLLDVHTARSPVAGRLESWTKLDGQCRTAMRQAAETENRRGQLTITPDGGSAVIGVLLAAGLIARRITQWARPGALTPGERLGIIHFGSRSVLYLPQDRYRVMVAAGDRLAAGRTPVARVLYRTPTYRRSGAVAYQTGKAPPP